MKKAVINLKVRLFCIISEEKYILRIYKISPYPTTAVFLLPSCQKAQAQTTATTTMLPMVASTAIHSQMVSLDTFPSSSASEGLEYPALRLEVDVCKDVLPLYGESMKAPLTAGKCCQGRGRGMEQRTRQTEEFRLKSFCLHKVYGKFKAIHWAELNTLVQ